MARAIEHWRATHPREQSPRYLMGESYGAVRAGLVVAARPKLRWNGVIDSAGRSVQQLFDEAVAFARSDYLVTLARDASLPAAERTMRA